MKKIFKEYVEEDYVRTLMINYVGVNHVVAFDNGTSSKVDEIDITTSKEQYGFTLKITCKNKSSEESLVSLQGTVRLSESEKIESLRIISGFDEYLETLQI